MSEPTAVRVDLGPRSYDIIVGEDLIGGAAARIAPVLRGRDVVVVTDENVAPLHLDHLTGSFRDSGLSHRAVTIPAGEATKSFAGLESLLDDLLQAGLERTSCLVALGGGVIGDLVGFAASVALRGIDFVQLPTTLLAQVDSSVGGKTGIDTAHGKNLVGAFHQPRLVLADTAALRTLPRRQWLSGYAEVAKYGLIDDAELFAWLEVNGPALLAGDAAALQQAVVASCRAKARIVAEDERESGRRALLNLGHTFAHALEVETGFGDDLMHGEAVAIGMVMAFELSTQLGLCPAADVTRVRDHLAGVGLPTDITDVRGGQWDAGRLFAHMGRDKKVEDGPADLRANTRHRRGIRGQGRGSGGRPAPATRGHRRLTGTGVLPAHGNRRRPPADPGLHPLAAGRLGVFVGLGNGADRCVPSAHAPAGAAGQ